jgi:PilZ domain
MVISKPLDEKREHPRFPVQFRSSFSSVNVVGGEGALADLSVRGCRIECRITVKPGTELQLKIHLPNEPAPLGITVAAVRWARGETFGVEFMDMHDEEWKRLGRFIASLERSEAGSTARP